MRSFYRSDACDDHFRKPASRTSTVPVVNVAAKPTRGDRTRRRLLDAGEQVFAAKGFHGTRVDDIVKVADTSHGTFYLYFANKDDLFHGLAREVAGDMIEHAGSLDPLTAGEDGVATLRRWL